MEIFLGIMVFVLGTCVGSFINMLVYRTAVRYGLLRRKTPRNDVGGRSFCDYCGRQLRWYENIPVVSWVIQKGKTRCCRNPLPWEYPIVELGVGIIFMIIGMRIELIIAMLLVFSVVFDLKYMILPDFSTYTLIVIGVIFFHNWLSGLGAGLFILGLYLITKGKGMGFGDVKLALFMGLFLGYPNILVAFYVAFILGAMVGIILIIFKIIKRQQPIPFGPFLVFGTAVSYVWGKNLLYYLSRWF